MVIGTSYDVTTEDEGMMQFVLDAFAGANKLEDTAEFPENIDACFEWMQQHSAEESNARREAMVCAIEADSSKLQASGAVDTWLVAPILKPVLLLRV